MKTKIIIISMLIFAGINLSAQSFTASNKMQWICPGVEKYTNLLDNETVITYQQGKYVKV